MSSIVLATTDAAFEQQVRRAFGNELNGDLRRHKSSLLDLDPERAASDLADLGPDVVAFGPDLPVHSAIKIAEVLDRDRPEINVLIVARPEPEIFEMALRAGVRDVVAPDAEDLELRRAFERAIATADRRRSNLVEEVLPSAPMGRVISVLAPKGGSGKTAVASNLAVALAKRHPGEVVLVDLDLLFGDVTNALLLRPEHSIADAASIGGRLDLTTLKVFLTPRQGGLYVLCAPETPALGEEVTETVVSRTLKLLAREFRYVIVDTSAGLNEATLAAIEQSTDQLLVCDLSVSAIRGLRKVVDALDHLGITARRHFVLNRADSKVGISLTDAVETVGLAVDAKIPSSRQLTIAMNEGVPIVESAPRSPLGRAFAAIADRISEEEEAEAASSVRFQWGRKK